MTASAQTRARLSPCIGVCKLDEQSGFCLGCGRTGGEIGAWSTLGGPERDAIWAELPERLKALAVRVRLLPLLGEEIRDWVAETITARKGTWVTGMPGGAAEFPCLAGREVAVETGSDFVVGRAQDANFRLRITDKVRAFAFEDDGPIVLGFPRGRVTLVTASVFTPLGSDIDAIDEKHSTHELFEFGLGRRASRFCVRTDDPALIATLRTFSGKPWAEMLAQAGAEIIAKSPARVVESQLARIEVFSPIPPPGGTSSPGAHTHLLPQFLATGEEIPAALSLPDYAAPLAIFYPGKPPA